MHAYSYYIPATVLYQRGASLETIQQTAERVAANVERVIIGKHNAVELLLVALMCRGHVLLEDVPGVGKTMLA